MNPDEARHAAQRTFGNTTLAKDDSRSAWIYRWLDDLGKDIHFGVRMLLKNRGFSAIAIISLALGFGLNTTIFTVGKRGAAPSVAVRDVSQLVQLDTIDAKTKFTQANAVKLGMSFPNFEDYRRQNDVFTDLVAWTAAALTWSGGTEPRQMQGYVVSANYFDVLGLSPAAGRFFFPDEDTKPNSNTVAVISHALWVNKFGGDPKIIGSNMTLNATPFTIIGVAPRGFKGTVSIADTEQVWVPVSMKDQVFAGFQAEFFNDRRFLGMILFGRLKPGITMQHAEASLRTVASRLEAEYPKDNGGRSVALTSIGEAAVGANAHDQFTLAGGMMLGGRRTGIAHCVREPCQSAAGAGCAPRKGNDRARGAPAPGGARLLRQLLTESTLLSLAGAAVGLLIAYWARHVLWSYRPSFIQQNDVDLSLDLHVLLFTLGIALFTGALFGAIPAIKASNPHLSEALKAGGRGNSVGWRANPVRSLLVIFETALALVALVGAGLFIRSSRMRSGLIRDSNPTSSS